MFGAMLMLSLADSKPKVQGVWEGWPSHPVESGAFLNRPEVRRALTLSDPRKGSGRESQRKMASSPQPLKGTLRSPWVWGFK